MIKNNWRNICNFLLIGFILIVLIPNGKFFVTKRNDYPVFALIYLETFYLLTKNG